MPAIMVEFATVTTMLLVPLGGLSRYQISLRRYVVPDAAVPQLPVALSSIAAMHPVKLVLPSFTPVTIVVGPGHVPVQPPSLSVLNDIPTSRTPFAPLPIVCDHVSVVFGPAFPPLAVEAALATKS